MQHYCKIQTTTINITRNLHPYEAYQLRLQRNLKHGMIRVVVKDGIPMTLLPEEKTDKVIELSKVPKEELENVSL